MNGRDYNEAPEGRQIIAAGRQPPVRRTNFPTSPGGATDHNGGASTNYTNYTNTGDRGKRERRKKEKEDEEDFLKPNKNESPGGATDHSGGASAPRTHDTPSHKRAPEGRQIIAVGRKPPVRRKNFPTKPQRGDRP